VETEHRGRLNFGIAFILREAKDLDFFFCDLVLIFKC
jgi:hypothetical protein